MGGIVNTIKDIGGAALGSGLGSVVLGPLGAIYGGLQGGGSNAISDIGGAISNPFDYLLGNNIPSELKNPQVTSFSTPGLNATYLSPTDLALTRTANTQQNLFGIGRAYNTAADKYTAMQTLVQPGYGALTQAGVKAIQDARRAAMGDLRQNLARRRVLGSSFAQNDINRTAAEYQKQENEFRAQTFVQELAQQQQLIGQQATARATAYNSYLQQSNLESGLAAQLSSGVSTLLSNNASLIAQMSNSGRDTILAGLGIGGLGLATGAFSNPFSSGGGGTALNTQNFLNTAQQALNMSSGGYLGIP